MTESISWRVSKDGKTVTAGGKRYSRAAFERQFEQITSLRVPRYPASGWSGGPVKQMHGTGSASVLNPGAKGTAEKNPSAPKVVVPTPSQSTPKSRRNINREQKIINKLNRTRNQGGITSSGGKKNVNPVYRNMGIGIPPGGTNFPNTLNQ